MRFAQSPEREYARTALPVHIGLIYVDSLTKTVGGFIPGAAMVPERPRRTHMRLSFGFLEPDEISEATRRLGVAIRAVRRARRPTARSLPIA